ncbi:pyridoxamine 5'-phosphate oxidase family protein [Microbispora sp. H13382]|uniref:pyridoxamine 5'-phosphate oxidase family protein n=1 Tax=Microbispora sp. H13382 TaxID=2729112 RepID=UPI002873406E|nr:pyridoxamine 5'-phosphate oxidase family protein [Microbispora sp. H13382]
MVKTRHHEGEQAVQKRAGEGHAGWGSPMFDDVIQPGFADFLRRQRMLVLGAADPGGAVWASLVTGDPGFADPVGHHNLVVAALPVAGDPLEHAFETERAVGTLAIEPQTMRRIRVNGVARRHEDRLHLRTEQVLGNCPKYLRQRVLLEDDPGSVRPAAASRADLGPRQQRWIAEADTFFIASHSPEHGADASHRGGEPGFVTVEGPRRLSWPDYVGNSFYMTLGNLHLNPSCGLLFPDWEQGHTLQLTGRARVDWDTRRSAALPGALRIVEFDVERAVEIRHATALRWGPGAFVPLRPGARRSFPRR